MHEARIISLVPSLTHTLVEMGMVDSIVGCTHFCVHPYKELKDKTRVGGTKDPDLNLIRGLEPTHILLNKEENRKEDFQILNDEFSVLVTHPQELEDVFVMLKDLGEYLNNPQQSKVLIDQLHSLASEIGKFEDAIKQSVYFIWKNPWMVATQNTYIGSMMKRFGYELTVADGFNLYPQVEISKELFEGIDSVFLSSEPWPFRKRDLNDLRSSIPEKVAVYRIDGMLTSWQGAMTIKSLEQFQKWKLGEKQHLVSRWI